MQKASLERTRDDFWHAQKYHRKASLSSFTRAPLYSAPSQTSAGLSPIVFDDYLSFHGDVPRPAYQWVRWLKKIEMPRWPPFFSPCAHRSWIPLKLPVVMRSKIECALPLADVTTSPHAGQLVKYCRTFRQKLPASHKILLSYYRPRALFQYTSNGRRLYNNTASK